MRRPVLATARLRFAPWAPEDLPLLVDLHSDGEVQRYLEIDGRPYGIGALREKLASFIAEYERHGWSKFKVLDGDGAFVGRAGFATYPVTGELELGYTFARRFWGRGYASEAASGLLAWIYEFAAIDHVIAFAAADNGASRRVLEKVGMAATGLRLLNGVPFAFYRHDRPTWPS